MRQFYGTLNEVEDALVGDIEELTIIDCHEHLPTEAKRLGSSPDAFTLFSHYCKGDLISAGMDEGTMNAVLFGDGDPEWKWREFKPYYGLIRHGDYARAAHIAMERFYGERELTDGNHAGVTDRIRAANVPGLYGRVLREACGIETCLNCYGWENEREGGLFSNLVWHAGDWDGYGRVCGNLGKEGPVTLDDVEGWCAGVADRAVREGIHGIKFMAYHDVPCSKAEASEALRRLMADPSLRLPRSNPLSLYVFNRMLHHAGERGVVCAVHTGYWGDYRELSPSNLIPAIQGNPKARMDVYHVGYPYMREAIMLAKSWPNVRLNMCWTYLISQNFAYQALYEMMEALPANKVFGFGGDYYVVEKVFGHLIMARETIARVLARRVAEGKSSYGQAALLARALLHDNPSEFYGL